MARSGTSLRANSRLTAGAALTVFRAEWSPFMEQDPKRVNEALASALDAVEPDGGRSVRFVARQLTCGPATGKRSTRETVSRSSAGGRRARQARGARHDFSGRSADTYWAGYGEDDWGFVAASVPGTWLNRWSDAIRWC